MEQEWLTELATKHHVIIDQDLFMKMQDNKFNSVQLTQDIVSGDFFDNSLVGDSFDAFFKRAVDKLGASKDVFFGWKGNIYTTEIKPHVEE